MLCREAALGLGGIDSCTRSEAPEAAERLSVTGKAQELLPGTE